MFDRRVRQIQTESWLAVGCISTKYGYPVVLPRKCVATVNAVACGTSTRVIVFYRCGYFKPTDQMKKAWQCRIARQASIVVALIFFVGCFELPYLSQLISKEKNSNAISSKTSTAASNKDTEPTSSRIWHIALIVELTGELGNQLALLSSALMTQIVAQTKYPNIRLQIVGAHWDNSKWRQSYSDIQLCFPHFRIIDGGILDPDRQAEFLQVKELQRLWMANFTTYQQELLTNSREEGLEFLQQQLLMLPEELHNYTSTSRRYSFPYLRTTPLDDAFKEGLKNPMYYESIRHWFRFNTSSEACCGSIQSRQQPSSVNESKEEIVDDKELHDSYPSTGRTNEVVYHHRNFYGELGRRAIGNYYTEANPNTVTHYIFGNTTAYNRNNTHITITSRFDRGLEPYIRSLQHHKGIATTVLSNRSSMQDFCYMMTTPRELVGKYHSTFVRWAAFLGTAKLNRFYVLNQNIDGIDNGSNFTSYNRPVHLLDYIKQNHRHFIFEQYWQPHKK